MSQHYFFTSVTRISDLSTQSFDVIPLAREQWDTGDYVVGKIVAPLTKRSLIENCHGRMVEVISGDMIVGAFGSRRATHEIVGDWRDIDVYLRMEALTEGGLMGKATSVSITITNIPPLVYQGHVMRNGQKVGMKDFIPNIPIQKYDCPTIMMLGTSMSSGKTTMSRLLIRLLKQLNLKIVGVKLAGAGQYHDILTMEDAGADAIFDFVNVGLPSTVCSPQEYQTAMNTLLSLVAQEKPDVVVAEIGASPFEPYNGAIVLEKIKPQICLTILCANDPYAVVGATDSFHLTPDIISGIVANTTAGIKLVNQLTGIEAICPTDEHAIEQLMPILQDKLKMAIAH